MTAALIVAAGSAVRMGFDKLLAPLGGEPVILRTLRAFEAAASINGVWVVSGEARGAMIRDLAAAAGLTKFRGLVPGGAERCLSVRNGLAALPDHCDTVAVHDGARPLISPDQIDRCVERAAAGAVACARRVTETVKRVDSSGRVTGDVDRDGLWIMETPQVMPLRDLTAAYQHVERAGITVTDEVSAMQLAGFPVSVVENPGPNPKITLPGDLEAAERLLSPGTLT